MREIKFRCWYDNRMHEVVDISFHYKEINLLGADIIKFEDGILMQYTGLHDKNGVEIYDGDILDYDGDLWIVEYSEQDGMFILQWEDVTENFSNMNSKWFEKIGNIYDNPDLLEKGE